MDYVTPKGIQKRIEFYHDGFKQKAPLLMAEVDQLPRPVTVYNYHPSELIVRMLQGTCEFCGNHENTVKVHHVAALKDLNPDKPWEAKMLSMRRKSLVVCDHCFALIQSDM